MQLADGTLVALPYTGIPRSNEAMARAVEHALVRPNDSSGSSIEIPAGTNNVIFGQSTTMNQDIDLDSMIEESGGVVNKQMLIGGGVGNQDVSTSSAGNAIASELTQSGERMMSSASSDAQKGFKNKQTKESDSKCFRMFQIILTFSFKTIFITARHGRRISANQAAACNSSFGNNTG